MTKLVTGIFSDRASAEHAYELLAHKGYGQKDVNIIMKDSTQKKYFSNDSQLNITTSDDEKSGSKVATGAALGGAAGLAAGLAMFLGALTPISWPAVGLMIYGPLSATLAGAGVGAAAGGFIEIFTSMGLDESEAQKYAEEINNGKILITVKPHEEADVASLRHILSSSLHDANHTPT